MSTIVEALTIATQRHQAGDLQTAESIYRQILQADPRQPDALHFLGVIAYQVGKHEIAIDCMKQSIALTPLNEGFHCNLGMAYQAAGKNDEAIASYRQALRLNPDSPGVLNNLGNALGAQGKLEEAIFNYERALRLQPDFADAHNNMGVALQKQGKLAEAEKFCRKALRLKPEYPEAHCNLGTALILMGRMEEAVDQLYRAIKLKPNYAEARSNLSAALQALGRLDEAEEHLRHAVAVQPDLPDAHNNLGGILQLKGNIEEAVVHYRAGLKLWADYSAAFSNILLCLNYDPKITDEALFAEHRQWGVRYGQVPGAGPSPGHDRNPNRRLRVGYVSPDLSSHPIAHFFQPILANHDPAQVEAICYSEVSAPDAMTARLQSLARNWRLIHGMSDHDAANLIRADRIDILVDLTGHTAKSRLRVFTHKPAPVQVTYLGYPHTTGLISMDYRLTDAIADPPHEIAWYTEELVRLPRGFCCYTAPCSLEISPLPALKNGYITFGSLHNLPKMNPMVLDLWCAILRRLPTSRLLMYRNTLHGQVKDHFHRELTLRGIDPSRFELRHSVLGLTSYMETYRDIDLSLDTFPWSGHTTTCEALWMGVPMVTLRGTRHAGRMVASVLTQVGLTDLIAETPEQFMDIALRLAQDTDRLATMRAHLREQVSNSPLCDGRSFTRDLEAAYRQMWQRWCGS